MTRVSETLIHDAAAPSAGGPSSGAGTGPGSASASAPQAGRGPDPGPEREPSVASSKDPDPRPGAGARHAADPAPGPLPLPPIVDRGVMPYADALARMRDHVTREAGLRTEALWIVAHPPVFTLGLSGRREHVLAAGEIPVVESDRGGQVTYHGPGQTIVYTLIDLKRRGIGIKRFVNLLEQAAIDLLADYGVAAARRAGAPGVYLSDAGADAGVGADAGTGTGAKIAALGLRLKDGMTYHGIALNVAMDLAPFSRIDPCGYRGLAVTDLAACGVSVTPAAAGRALAEAIRRQLAGAASGAPPRDPATRII